MSLNDPSDAGSSIAVVSGLPDPDEPPLSPPQPARRATNTVTAARAVRLRGTRASMPQVGPKWDSDDPKLTLTRAESAVRFAACRLEQSPSASRSWHWERRQ